MGRRVPPPMPPTPRMTIRVAASPAGIAAAADGLDRFGARQGLPPDALWPVRLALDEILSNIVLHGAGRWVGRQVEIGFKRTDAAFEVTVTDDGPEFDPLHLPEPDLTSPLQERQPGGLGIHFVRRLMDRVEYQRQEGRNHLFFSRRIAVPDGGDRGRE